MNNTDQTILVTGGTGFVGTQCILQLLEKGYTIKTTIRSLAKKDQLISTLEKASANNIDRLTFIEADLTTDRNWNEAVKACDYVLHVASPFPAVNPEDENELIIPARDGALRVLKAARNAGVKRVVITSSFAAIGYSKDAKDHVFTELDWTDENIQLPAYIKSKTVAEKAAWDFMEKEGGDLELVVINPVGIFGPALGNDYSASVQVVQGLLAGAITESPNFTMGVVDVRDVADIHIRAMLHPEAKGERFLATANGVMSFYDVAELIKKERSAFAENVADLNQTDLSFYIELSNKKARTVLGWIPRSKEEAILASVDSLI